MYRIFVDIWYTIFNVMNHKESNQLNTLLYIVYGFLSIIVS